MLPQRLKIRIHISCAMNHAVAVATHEQQARRDAWRFAGHKLSLRVRAGRQEFTVGMERFGRLWVR